MRVEVSYDSLFPPLYICRKEKNLLVEPAHVLKLRQGFVVIGMTFRREKIPAELAVGPLVGGRRVLRIQNAAREGRGADAVP